MEQLSVSVSVSVLVCSVFGPPHSCSFFYLIMPFTAVVLLRTDGREPKFQAPS